MKEVVAELQRRREQAWGGGGKARIEAQHAASVLSASRLEPLAPFPLASPVRFSRSVRKPDRESRRLHAGCRSVRIRTSPELIPEEGSPPRF